MGSKCYSNGQAWGVYYYPKCGARPFAGLRAVDLNVSERRGLVNIGTLYRLAGRMHALIPYYLARNGRAFPAWHYYLEVTRSCNLRCVMCQYIQWLRNTSVAEQREGELTTAEWFGVIDQIPRFSLVTFTGGEPFLREDFLQLLEYAGRRTRTHFISNATMLNEERARRCVELAPKRLGGKGLNVIGVSIDGPKDVHERIRLMPNAFDKSLDGIRMIRELREKAGKKCPLVHVTTVIQKDNLAHLSQMPRVVADIGADVLNFTLEIRNQELEGLGEADPSKYPVSAISFPKLDPRRLAEALKQTRSVAQERGVTLRMPDMPDEEIVRYYNGEMDRRDFRCEAIWTTMIVGSKGDLYPCWLKRVGNIRENKLREVWNSPEMRAFRVRTRKGLYAPCLGCCFQVYAK